jgi:hypothetical protein
MAAAIFVALFVISVVLSAQLCAVMGNASPVLREAVQPIVETARPDYPQGGPATAHLTRYKGSELGQPGKRTTRNPVDRVGLNIVEVCCRKNTRGLKSREFVRMGLRLHEDNPEEINGHAAGVNQDSMRGEAPMPHSHPERPFAEPSAIFFI